MQYLWFTVKVTSKPLLLLLCTICFPFKSIRRSGWSFKRKWKYLNCFWTCLPQSAHNSLLHCVLSNACIPFQTAESNNLLWPPSLFFNYFFCIRFTSPVLPQATRGAYQQLLHLAYCYQPGLVHTHKYTAYAPSLSPFPYHCLIHKPGNECYGAYQRPQGPGIHFT